MSLPLPQPETLAALYREHGRAIRAFIGAKLRDTVQVEDLCQETFVAALEGGVPEAGAGRWLFGIARNKVLKHIRDCKPTSPLREPPDAGDGPSESADKGEDRSRVRAAVSDLHDELREVICLRYEGGLGYAEIADRLELPLTTVQGRLKRARIELRRRLILGGAQ